MHGESWWKHNSIAILKRTERKKKWKDEDMFCVMKLYFVG
jgi:hypothetical protein